MGIWDVLRGHSAPRQANLDALFALPSAAMTLEASLGLHPSGTGAVCFRAAEGMAAGVSQREAADLIGVDGTVFRTRRGELSVKVEDWTLLAKSLRPPPEKHHGLQDVEIRQRHRELDLIANEEARELFITRRLEAALTKRRILEIYLNVIEWGDGVFGCEAAARAYFGKSAAGLSREEAALMAGAIINPREMNVARPNRRLLRRQQIVLRRMGDAD